MQLEKQIQLYLIENLLFTDSYNFDNNASFLQEGILDSVGVMELVSFVESTFAIRVAPDEVTPKNFDSVAKLASYIRSKLASPNP